MGLPSSGVDLPKVHLMLVADADFKTCPAGPGRAKALA
jgi:hypothetical protein